MRLLIPMLLALAVSAPAQAQEPAAAPALPTVAALRESMLASDSILVARVELETHVIADTSGKSRTDVRSKRVAVNQVRHDWMQRLVANLLPEGTPELAGELCPTPRVAASLEKPWMLTALWITPTGRGQVYLNLVNGCASLGLAGGRPGGLMTIVHTDSLLALFQQALYADSALRTVPMRLLADTSRAARIAAIETMPEATVRVAPSYPEAERKAGHEGVVTVRALVSAEGDVKMTEIMTSVPGFDEAAMDAVRQWKFKPATADGVPRAVWVAIPVTFRLNGAHKASHP
jgi:TonB family protein